MSKYSDLQEQYNNLNRRYDQLNKELTAIKLDNIHYIQTIRSLHWALNIASKMVRDSQANNFDKLFLAD